MDVYRNLPHCFLLCPQYESIIYDSIYIIDYFESAESQCSMDVEVECRKFNHENGDYNVLAMLSTGQPLPIFISNTGFLIRMIP